MTTKTDLLYHIKHGMTRIVTYNSIYIVAFYIYPVARICSQFLCFLRVCVKCKLNVLIAFMLQDDNNFLKFSIISGIINKVFLIQIPRNHEYGLIIGLLGVLYI